MAVLLLCEDNPRIRRAVSAGLQGSGHTLLSAADGATGLDLARRNRVDLVITDITMPVMDGFELCEALHSRPETSTLPVLLLTAGASATVRRYAAMHAGVDYLPKPYHLTDLVERIDTLLRAPRTQRGGRRATSSRVDTPTSSAAAETR
ncbi:MAG: response regulator [Kineosporiaceae bacterium]